MSLLDESSAECLNSELELFEIPPTQTSIGDSYWVNYFPTTSLNRNAPLEFVIKTSNDVYLDLAHTMLYTQTRILKEDNTPMVKSAESDLRDPKNSVSCINYYHATQWKNIEVFINGRLISTSDNMASYRAYLESLLTFSRDAKNDQLACSLFHLDTGDNIDVFEDDIISDINEAKNIGLQKRLKKTGYSKLFETQGRIHADIFNQSKLFPGGHEIRIKFHRHASDYSLFSKSSESRYNISNQKAVLMVRHCQISSHILESHNKALQTRNLKFPLNRVLMKFYTHGSGLNDLSEQNLVTGPLPTKVIIGLVRSDAFNGQLDKNPLNFQHFNLQNIVLRKNGNPLPLEGIETNFTDGIYYQAYMSLIQATGNLYSDGGFNISPNQYQQGCVLVGFDLTPDLGNCDSLNLINEGTLSLEIKLASSSQTSITTVVYLSYESILEIDRDGNVFLNE